MTFKMFLIELIGSTDMEVFIVNVPIVVPGLHPVNWIIKKGTFASNKPPGCN